MDSLLVNEQLPLNFPDADCHSRDIYVALEHAAVQGRCAGELARHIIRPMLIARHIAAPAAFPDA